ncbi:MAG: hypothetical protein WCJ61_17805, partial [Paludibacter sp.]
NRIFVGNYGYRELFRVFLRTDKYEGITSHLNKDIFFSTVSSRPNYIQLDKNCLHHLPEVEIYQHLKTEIKYFKITHVLVSLLWFMKSLILKPKGWTIKELLFVAGKMCFALNTISFLKYSFINEIKVKKAIFHDPNFGNDAILCAFFKRIGIPTYSLQHSYNFEFKIFNPEEIIKYDTDFADYYLCWSKNQMKLLKQSFNQKGSNLVLAGNPNLMNHSLPAIKQSFKRCLVLLSRFYYHNENLQLLDELSKINGIEFIVRPHPSLKELPDSIDFNVYITKCKLYGFELNETQMSFDNLINEYQLDFGICLNTAAYFDCYAQGLICFRYANNENEFLEGLDDRFIDSITLLSLVNKYAKMNQSNLYKDIKSMLESEIGIGIFNYPQII